MTEKLGCKTTEVKLGGKCFPIGKERYGVTVRSARMTKGGFLKVEGKNDVGQSFVEYHKNDKLRGMILKMPKNNFWYVLKGTVMVFDKKKAGGYEMPVGSKSKSAALAKLRKSVKVS